MHRDHRKAEPEKRSRWHFALKMDLATLSINYQTSCAKICEMGCIKYARRQNHFKYLQFSRRYSVALNLTNIH